MENKRDKNMYITQKYIIMYFNEFNEFKLPCDYISRLGHDSKNKKC
jgi:hypothetical protein